MIKASLLMMGALLLTQVGSIDVGYKHLGTIETKHPAFLEISKFGDGPEFLLISSFAALGKGSVSIIPNLADVLAKKDFSVEATIIKGGYQWPNEVRPIPQNVFNDGNNYIIVPDGFLVPLHTNGGIYVIQVDPTDVTQEINEQITISQEKKGFFYHTGKWIDMNDDGRLDLLTARTNAKYGEGELLWLEHPKGGLGTAPWTEHIIDNGPDVEIEVVEMPQYGDSIIVFSAEFFTHQVAVRQISKTSGRMI
jgi:hypothetical protein